MSTGAATTGSARGELLAAIAIAALTLAVYAGVAGHEFVTFDDGKYVFENAMVRAGLTFEGVHWAFTTTTASNWHPLTWLSHMLDCELFGLDAGRHHLTNALLHATNAALLFVALNRLRTGVQVAAITALLFALHPLRVESVAWVSERKDVLAGLFWMLGLLAWAAYVRGPSKRRYALVAACLALGLLAKPMLVSFPFVLLLLDLWPLRRMARSNWKRRVAEKLPLVALVMLAAAVTLFAQERGGAVSDLETLPLAARCSHALVATATYLGKLLWPAQLACFYPHPALVDPHYAAFGLMAWLAGALLLGLTLVAWITRRRAPFLAAGWGWTVVTLLPVIGIVQVGTQALADRYAYLPLIGVTLALVAGAAELRRRVPATRHGITLLAVLAIVACGVQARRQIETWRDSITLFEHALSVTEHNFVAHIHLGGQRAATGDLPRARRHLQAALAITPSDPHALTNLAIVLGRSGEPARARELFEQALHSAPGFVPAHIGLGALLERGGDDERAARHYRLAARAEPSSFGAHANLGSLLLFGGALDEAEQHLVRAAQLDPSDALNHNNLGVLYQRRDQLESAEEHFAAAARLDPKSAHAHSNLGLVRERLGRPDEARELYRRAAELDPRFPDAPINLGLSYETSGELAAAVAAYRRALASDPTRPIAATRLAWILATHVELFPEGAAEALGWATQLAEGGHFEVATDLDLLAAAHAAAGDFLDAVRWQERALELAPDGGADQRAERERRLARFRNEHALEAR